MPKPASGQTQQNEYYFDSQYLQQYLSQNAKLKVLVNGSWLNIADESDLQDEATGVGYDTSGKAHFIDYREIQSVKAAGKTVTLDQLQSMVNTDAPDEESQDVESEPPESKSSDAEDLNPDQKQPPADNEEPVSDDEKNLEKQPEKASYDPYMVGRKILSENSKKQRESIGLGQFIKITDRTSIYEGKRGSVSGILGDLLEVRMYNAAQNSIETIYVNKNLVERVL